MHLCLSEMPSVWNHNCPVYSNSFCSCRIYNVNKSIIVSTVLFKALIAKIHKYLQLHWYVSVWDHSFVHEMSFSSNISRNEIVFLFFLYNRIINQELSMLYYVFDEWFFETNIIFPNVDQMVHEFTINNLMDQRFRKIACLHNRWLSKTLVISMIQVT